MKADGHQSCHPGHHGQGYVIGSPCPGVGAPQRTQGSPRMTSGEGWMLTAGDMLMPPQVDRIDPSLVSG